MKKATYIYNQFKVQLVQNGLKWTKLHKWTKRKPYWTELGQMKQNRSNWTEWTKMNQKQMNWTILGRNGSNGPKGTDLDLSGP